MADAFSATRTRPWRGWNALALPVQGTPRILDIGCGNARLFRHLRARHRGALHYTGVDFSRELLREAERLGALYGQDGDELRFVLDDIHTTHLPALGRFERICVFGVLHHICGRSRRERLLGRLRQALAPGGELWITLWQFGDDPQFRARPAPSPIEIPVEPGGAWLSFAGRGQRFCVQVGDEEVDGYPSATGLRERHRFREDGRSGRLNLYVVYGLG